MAKILVVDDEQDICDFIVRFFKKRNFEVLSATNGNDALLAIRKDRPDVVLLEMAIKDISGIEVLTHIKKMNQNIKIIVITRANDIEIMNEAKRRGAMAYLTKPILLSELMDLVLRNLGGQHRFLELKRVTRDV